MLVKDIKLINFRNYLNTHIKLNHKLNVFIGNNAQGKTNLLESIYLSSYGKSFRKNREDELIHIDKDKCYIGLNLKKKYDDKFIEIKLEKNKSKRTRINKLELEKNSELIGVFNVVIFSPEDLKIIKGGPNERRSFLDNEISQLKPRYRYNIKRYNKIVLQRNNLLKNIQDNREKIKILDVWNEQLCEFGSEIIIDRIQFLNTISNISKDIHKKITGGVEELEIHYISSLKLEDNLKSFTKEDVFERFINLLNKNIEYEIDRGTTQFGPHRDDIKILINNIDSRTFGSQGQQRTAALSLKLSEVELIHREIGEYPVLLLDDVLSELDNNRKKYLISTFKDIQTVITSTDDINFSYMEKLEKSVYKIQNGKIVR